MRHQLFRFKHHNIDVETLVKQNKRFTSHARFERTDPVFAPSRFDSDDADLPLDVSKLSKDEFQCRSGYKLTTEAACRIPTSRTLLVCSKDVEEVFDNGLICQDHNTWLSTVGGILSQTQMQNMENIGDQHLFDSCETVETFRPPRYCRAAIVASSDFKPQYRFPRGDGLVDVKGCGVSEGMVPLARFDHHNGVYFIYEAFREYVKYKILKGLEKEGAPFKVLPILGIVDLGIALEMPGFPPMPICTLVRAPHCRDPENCERPMIGSPMLDNKILIEKFLQKNGLSSTMVGFSAKENEEGLLTLSHGYTPVKISEHEVRAFAASKGYEVPFETDYINVQLCDRRVWCERSNTLVDLLHYRTLDRMKPRSVALARNGVFGWGMDMANRHSCPNLDRIREHLGDVEDLPSVLDREQLSWAAPWKSIMKIRDRLSIWTIKIAHDYMTGRLLGDDLRVLLDRYAENCLEAMEHKAS